MLVAMRHSQRPTLVMHVLCHALYYKQHVPNTAHRHDLNQLAYIGVLRNGVCVCVHINTNSTCTVTYNDYDDILYDMGSQGPGTLRNYTGTTLPQIDGDPAKGFCKDYPAWDRVRWILSILHRPRYCMRWEL